MHFGSPLLSEKAAGNVVALPRRFVVDRNPLDLFWGILLNGPVVTRTTVYFYIICIYAVVLALNTLEYGSPTMEKKVEPPIFPQWNQDLVASLEQICKDHALSQVALLFCYSHVKWSWWWELNPQSPVYKTGALPLSYTSSVLSVVVG
jgi:hypothetical protein